MPRLASTAVLLALAALATAPAASAAPAHRLVPRAWAKQFHVGAAQGAKDHDHDGLSNWGEYRAGTDPHRRDSDRDGISDALEDRDSDHVANADEVAAGMDPRRRDSDHDGVPDGREDSDHDGLANADERPTGHNLIKADSDGDGVPDGADNAGRISAVSAGAARIKLAQGGMLSGQLTGDSWIDCTATLPTAGATASSVPAADPASGSGTDANGDDADNADPTPAPDDPPLSDDPAGLATFASVDDGTDSGDAGAADLSACGASLYVGAYVHKAALVAGVLTELELMQG
jgi:hypothetical protein